MNTPCRTRVVIEGRVQGVFFRDSTRSEALRFGVDGWVRNLPDGSVEAVFEGPCESVAAVVEWSRQGPQRAVVTRVTTTQESPEGLVGFRILG